MKWPLDDPMARAGRLAFPSPFFSRLTILMVSFQIWLSSQAAPWMYVRRQAKQKRAATR
jgi:hypothetical protein